MLSGTCMPHDVIHTAATNVTVLVRRTYELHSCDATARINRSCHASSQTSLRSLRTSDNAHLVAHPMVPLPSISFLRSARCKIHLTPLRREHSYRRSRRTCLSTCFALSTHPYPSFHPPPPLPSSSFLLPPSSNACSALGCLRARAKRKEVSCRRRHPSRSRSPVVAYLVHEPTKRLAGEPFANESGTVRGRPLSPPLALGHPVRLLGDA